MGVDISGVRNRLHEEKAALDRAWQAREMLHIHMAIDSILSKLSQVSYAINAIERDIRITEQEIRREDEAAAAAAAAALREALERAKVGNLEMQRP